MNENFNPYEVAEAMEAKGSSGNNSSTGIVTGWAIASKAEMQENGSAVLVFTKVFESGKSLSIKQYLNPVDVENVQVYEGDTKETAAAKAITKQLRLFKQLGREYQDADFVDGAFTGKRSFGELVEALNTCLPDDVATRQGRLVVGYNTKGYLAIPNRLQWDADTKQFLPYFSLDENQKMQNMPNNLSLTKPEQNTEVPADTIEF